MFSAVTVVYVSTVSSAQIASRLFHLGFQVLCWFANNRKRIGYRSDLCGTFRFRSFLLILSCYHSRTFFLSLRSHLNEEKCNSTCRYILFTSQQNIIWYVIKFELYCTLTEKVESANVNVGGKMNGLQLPADIALADSVDQLFAAEKHLLGSLVVHGHLYVGSNLSGVNLTAYCQAISSNSSTLHIQGMLL